MITEDAVGEAEPAFQMGRDSCHAFILLSFPFSQEVVIQHRTEEKPARRKTPASVLLLLLRVSVFVGVFVLYLCVRVPVHRRDLVRDLFLSFACLPLQNPSVPQTDTLVSGSCPVRL